MSVVTHPIQLPNHSTPKKGEHITIHSQQTHSHQSHYHSPNADPSKTQSSFITLPSSYLCCVLLVSWLVLASSPAPQQSPIQCLQTLDQHELKPLHTTSTEIASLPDMSDQRCSPASCNKQRSWSQAIVTTSKKLASTTIPRTTASSTSRSENGSATRQLTQQGFDDCPTQPVALRLTNRSHAGRLQRHPPAFDACRCSNTITEAHLRSTLQITRVDSNSHLNARRHFTQRISRDHDTPRLLRGIHSFDIR